MNVSVNAKLNYSVPATDTESLVCSKRFIILLVAILPMNIQ